MTQPSAPATSSFSSKLRQPKYIIAIALVIIIIVSGVTAAYFLTLPKASSPYKIVTGTSAQIRYLVFNLNKVTDVRVRQAIAYAVDRGAINSNVFYNQTQPLYSMVPPSMPYSQPVFQTTYGSSPNLAKAQALLTQAGYNSTTGKLAIDLWYNSDGHYGDTEPTAALVLKTSIEKTGMIIINLKSETWAQFVPDRRAGTFPLFMLGWYPDYFDSDDYVSPFLTASGAKALGSFYNNATVTGWINQEELTVNDTLRAGVFGQIQNAVASSVPYVPLWQGSANIGYRSDINGVYLHPVVFKYFTMSRPGATQLNAGTTDSVVCLDPVCAYDYFSIEVINQVFDTLLVYAPNSTTLLPGLASQVPTVANGGISTDGKNYTYHLRQGVKFTDGTAFNATVMKWSIERAIALGDSFSPNYDAAKYGTSSAFLLFDVGKIGNNTNWSTQTNDGIIVIDPYTIRFHLSSPVSFFNDLMAYSVSAPVSMSAYSKTSGQADIPVSKVVGTGPYMVSSYTPSQSITLTNNPNYYNPGVYSSYGIPSIPIFTKIVITFYGNALGLKNALLSGQIDLAYRTLNPQDVTALARQYGS
jgi:ABC-type transport system substrate-binding protein